MAVAALALPAFARAAYIVKPWPAGKAPPPLTLVDIDGKAWSLAALRGGPVLLKGILTAEDARLALDHGADGVIVSNHGGRQLEGAMSAVQALPEIAAAVGGKLEVILDGGIRRGADVVRACALGAKACMIGRAWLYGLASGGQSGVERALEILRDEIDIALTLLGRPTLAEINMRVLRESR